MSFAEFGILYRLGRPKRSMARLLVTEEFCQDVPLFAATRMAFEGKQPHTPPNLQ